MTRHALVFGATGLVGRHVVRARRGWAACPERRFPDTEQDSQAEPGLAGTLPGLAE